jgi:DNA-binding response OmpR family regulator
VARILIVEPHPDVRELFARVLARLGHETVRLEDLGGDDAAVAAAVLEPAFPGALELARSLRARGVPVVCASIEPCTSEVRALEPVAHLLKPFALRELEAAVDAALAAGGTLVA